MMQEIVRLMHYDPRWRQEFLQTRSGILQSCQGWVVSVEHVGSTAIGGLVARPTIDTLAGVTSAEAFRPASTLLQGLHYRRSESPAWAADAIVMHKYRHTAGEIPEVTHQILLTEVDSPLWRRVLATRNWLRTHAEDAVRFEEAKVARWRSGAGDPDRYRSDKAIFFAHLEDQIEASRGGSRDGQGGTST